MEETHTKWHRMTREAVIATLHTDAACGLSRRAARSLYRKRGANTLFQPGEDPIRVALCGLLRDPGFLLMSVLLLLLIPISPMTVLPALGVMTVAVAIRIPGLWRTRRMLLQVRASRIPHVTVIREGRLWRLSARVVVPGDLLLLREGDILPGDCRLLSADGLRVLTPVLDGEGRLRMVETAKDPERIYPIGADGEAPYYENMLFGASEILSGEGRAIVVSVGAESYRGALAASEERHGRERMRPSASPLLRAWGILVPTLSAVLLFISFFTRTEEAGPMAILCESLILLGGSAPGLIAFYGAMGSLQGRLSLLSERLPANRVLLSDGRILERLSRVDEVFVMGKWGSSDGVPRLLRAAVGREVITPEPEDGKGAAYSSLTEALAIYAASLEKPSVGAFEPLLSREAIAALCKAGALDEEALRIRLLAADLTVLSERGLHRVDVRMRDGATTLLFGDGGGLLRDCTSFEEKGRQLYLDGEQHARLWKFVDAAYAEAARVVTVAREEADGSLTLIALAALREELQAVLPSVLEELRRGGVRVTFFLNGDPEEVKSYANAARIPGGRSVYDGCGIDEDCLRDCRVMIGYPVGSVSELLKRMRAEGRHVMLLGGGRDARRLLSSAYLTAAVNPSVKVGGEATEAAVTEERANGAPDGKRSLLSLSMGAQLLLPRAERLGGGLSALLSALTAARAAEVRRTAMTYFLSRTQASRVFLILWMSLFGLLPLPAWQMMLVTLLAESVGVLCLFLLPIPQHRLRKREGRKSVLPSGRCMFFLGLVTLLITLSVGILVWTESIAPGTSSLLLGFALLFYELCTVGRSALSFFAGKTLFFGRTAK